MPEITQADVSELLARIEEQRLRASSLDKKIGLAAAFALIRIWYAEHDAGVMVDAAPLKDENARRVVEYNRQVNYGNDRPPPRLIR